MLHFTGDGFFRCLLKEVSCFGCCHCRCKEAAEVTTSGSPFEKAAGQSNAAAARRLGLHYLQRYFYLITFVVYLESSSVKEVSFARWMADRKELKHLLSTLSLEPAI